MKIAYFTDTYKPQINGVVRSIELFSRELRRNNSVHIFSPSTIKERHSYKFPSIEFKNYPGYRIALPYSMMYHDLFKRIDFDIVHIHSPFTMGLAGLMFAKKRKIPVIGTFHTLLPQYLHYIVTSKKLMHIRWIKNNLKKMSWDYLRRFYNRCDIVISPTEEIKKILERNGIQNVHVIPTGIDMRKRKYTKNIKKKFGLQGKIILHTGRVTEEKNIEDIIKMLLPILKKKEATFVITSDGPHREKLEEIVKKLKISENVLFTGYLNEMDLTGFYKNSNVFVMASKSETQGLVLLEAASAGLSSIVLNMPVISDIVKQNKLGSVATKKNFASIVRKRLKKKIIIKKSAIAKYDIIKTTKQLKNLYEKTISQSQ